MKQTPDIEGLFAALRAGDRAALDAVFTLVYDRLRAAAHRQLSNQAPGRTLNTTALVHETYLKLARSAGLGPLDRSRFFRLAATAMRQILVDHARARLTGKRGGDWIPIETGKAGLGIEARASELVDLDGALTALETLEPRLGRVVELRFFAGLSVEETAEALDIAPRTVKRDWQKARLYLSRALAEVTE